MPNAAGSRGHSTCAPLCAPPPMSTPIQSPSSLTLTQPHNRLLGPQSRPPTALTSPMAFPRILPANAYACRASLVRARPGIKFVLSIIPYLCLSVTITGALHHRFISAWSLQENEYTKLPTRCTYAMPLPTRGKSLAAKVLYERLRLRRGKPRAEAEAEASEAQNKNRRN